MLSLVCVLTLSAHSNFTPVAHERPAFDTANVLATSVVDIDGAVHKLGTSGQLHPVALVFLGTTCPVSSRYAPELNEMAKTASEAGVAFYGVLSEPDLSVAEANTYREEYGLHFPILFDRSGDLAGRLGPTHVPEAFIVDIKDRVAYRGRIDDRFAAVTKLKPKISSRDLLDAIGAISKSALPDPLRTEPVGCIFEAWDKEIPASEVTYSRDIAPILNANCVGCHRPNDVGPFELQTYEQASKRAKMLAMVTSERIMPPWKAERGFGHFRDERFLSAHQIELLSKWAESGAPRGDAKDELPPAEVSVTRWRMGEPDLVVDMPLDYPVPAEGEDIYRYFVIPSELVGDKLIAGVDFRPGDPSVVHHCLAYIDYTGWARKQDARDDEPGFSVWGNDLSGRMQTVAGWAPGTPPYQYPAGHAMQLAGGGDFVLEIHYHLNGKETTDKSSLALYLTDKPVEKFVDTIFMGTEQIDIEPGDPAYARRVYMDVPADMTLIDVLPHMHYIGKRVEAFAVLPGGEQVPLIKITEWDFRWQDTYIYREPIHLPRGSRIEAFFEYDNSDLNPFNPNSPPEQVLEGWQTTDEMCIFYMKVAVDDPSKRKLVKDAGFGSFGHSANPWE